MWLFIFNKGLNFDWIFDIIGPSAFSAFFRVDILILSWPLLRILL